MNPEAESPARVVSRSGTTTSVAVRGEIDIANAAQLRTCLTGCLVDGWANITIDMQELTFIDASGLSVLAEISRLANAGCGHLTLQKPPAIVTKLLDISGLDNLIHVDNPDSRREQP
jgi:anti-sigma B factor antagonist